MSRQVRALVLPLALTAAACDVEIPFDHARNESGGEGAIVLDPGEAPASADMTLRATLLVGPSGLAQGGGFRLMLPFDPVHPFHGFTPPQIETWLQPGFIWCITRQGAREGPRARASVGPAGEARCTLKTGRLEAGDSMTLIYYGLAPRVAGEWHLAAETRYSGGRGARRVARDPVFTVTPRPARALAAVLPSLVHGGRPAALSIVALDEFGNRATSYRGPVKITAGDAVVAGPEEFRDGAAQVPLVPPGGGFLRALVEETDGPPEFRLSARSNPAVVVGAAMDEPPGGRPGGTAVPGRPGPGPFILWGDPHFHTGTGAANVPFLPRGARAGDMRGNATSQEQAVMYARDTARLDFAGAAEYASSSFPSGGGRAPSGLFARNDGGGESPFTLIRGLTWRDRVVLFAGEPDHVIAEDSRLTGDVGALRRALAPADFVEILIGGAAPRGGETGFEVYSWLNRGDSYDDAPRRFEPAPGWLAGTDPACASGAVIAAFAGSASHWGRPGTIDRTGLETGAGGLTAVFASGRSPEEILAAFRQGRTWATTGQRMILRVEPDDDGETVRVNAAGVVALSKVELVLVERTGVTETALGEPGALDLSGTFPLRHGAGPALWYVRATQADGGIAWSAAHCF